MYLVKNVTEQGLNGLNTCMPQNEVHRWVSTYRVRLAIEGVQRVTTIIPEMGSLTHLTLSKNMLKLEKTVKASCQGALQSISPPMDSSHNEPKLPAQQRQTYNKFFCGLLLIKSMEMNPSGLNLIPLKSIKVHHILIPNVHEKLLWKYQRYPFHLSNSSSHISDWKIMPHQCIYKRIWDLEKDF